MTDFTDPALARMAELLDALGLPDELIAAAEREALQRICNWSTAADILKLCRVIRRARGQDR
ncbi:MAG: hypothetical protein ACRDWG_12130 [Actinomycetes bacterium]